MKKANPILQFKMEEFESTGNTDNTVGVLVPATPSVAYDVRPDSSEWPSIFFETVTQVERERSELLKSSGDETFASTSKTRTTTRKGHIVRPRMLRTVGDRSEITDHAHAILQKSSFCQQREVNLRLEKQLQLQKDELELCKRIVDVQSIAVASLQRQIELMNRDFGELRSKLDSLEINLKNPKFVTRNDRRADEPLKQIQPTAATGGGNKRLKKNMGQSPLSCTAKLEGADSGDENQKNKNVDIEVLCAKCEYCGYKSSRKYFGGIKKHQMWHCKMIPEDKAGLVEDRLTICEHCNVEMNKQSVKAHLPKCRALTRQRNRNNRPGKLEN